VPVSFNDGLTQLPHQIFLGFSAFMDFVGLIENLYILVVVFVVFKISVTSLSLYRNLNFCRSKREKQEQVV
jgi:hypothetical protein